MSRGLLGILKLFLFVVLIPMIIAVIVAFQKELTVLKAAPTIFGWGVAAYTICHLFIFNPQGVYKFWQGVFLEICSFAGTVANIIVLAVPIVTTILLLVYFISTIVFRQPWALEGMIFFAGFTLAFHVVLSGQDLYEADDTMLKGHYFFALGLMVMMNVVIAAGLMNLIFKDFSFVAFWKEGVKITWYLYKNLLSAVGIRF